MTRLREDQRRFLDENPYVGVVTTLRRDGSPHSTVVWVDAPDGVVSFNTARGRAKDAHLKRDPRVSLVVVDPEDQYRWVMVSGTAEMTEEGADDHIDRLSKKYVGKDSYQGRKPGMVRVTVNVTPEKIDSSGF
ncbi:MAG TPA: PPOX class F420-dependent oxidoreductase [Gaiellaceae bacterium]|jgi:PPOX class probable F420-dependent enzyme